MTAIYELYDALLTIKDYCVKRQYMRGLPTH